MRSWVRPARDLNLDKWAWTLDWLFIDLITLSSDFMLGEIIIDYANRSLTCLGIPFGNRTLEFYVVELRWCHLEQYIMNKLISSVASTMLQSVFKPFLSLLRVATIYLLNDGSVSGARGWRLWSLVLYFRKKLKDWSTIYQAIWIPYYQRNFLGFGSSTECSPDIGALYAWTITAKLRRVSETENW